MKLSTLLASLALAGTTLIGIDVLACGNSMRHDREPDLLKEAFEDLDGGQESRKTILQAESSFQNQNYRQAARTVFSIHPELEDGSMAYTKLHDPEAIRGARIAAISLIRLDGKARMDDSGKKIPRSRKARTRVLDWSIAVIRHQLNAQLDDPALKGYLAEGLSRTDAAGKKEALSLLDGLGKADLIVDAHGWATYAELLKAEGRADEAKKARTRCVSTAQTPSICSGTKPRAVRKNRKKRSRKAPSSKPKALL